MVKTRHPRPPFVVTLAALAGSGACQSEVLVFTPTGSGGASSSAGPTTSSSSSSAAGPTTSASSGGGSVPDNCPADAPTSYEACPIGEDASCTYTLDCQSGPVQLTFVCSEDEFGWRVADQACDFEYDSCMGTELYCSGQWWMPQGTNPPSPCPNDPPEEFSTCWAGGMGGMHEHCGYRCDETGAWTVATCSGTFDEEGSWEYDGTCAP